MFIVIIMKYHHLDRAEIIIIIEKCLCIIKLINILNFINIMKLFISIYS